MKKTLQSVTAAALLAALLAAPAMAQTTDTAAADANRAAEGGDVMGDPEDDGFDHWGLLGLLGLAGLMKRPKHDVHVRHDHTNTTNPPR